MRAAVVVLADYRVEFARETAATYRQARLKSRFGAEARSMLDAAGIDYEIAEALRIGISDNDPFDLIARLVGKGIGIDDAKSAGVVDTRGSDPLHGTIVVPVLDIAGRIAAFLPWDLAWMRRGQA